MKLSYFIKVFEKQYLTINVKLFFLHWFVVLWNKINNKWKYDSMEAVKWCHGGMSKSTIFLNDIYVKWMHLLWHHLLKNLTVPKGSSNNLLNIVCLIDIKQSLSISNYHQVWKSFRVNLSFKKQDGYPVSKYIEVVMGIFMAQCT